MGTFSKLSWFFKEHRKRYLLGIIALVITAAANLVPPRVLGIMADQLDTGKIGWGQFFTYLIAIIIAAAFLYFFRFYWRKEIYGGAAILEKELRGKLYWHFLQMDRTFFQRYRTGDLMARATNDVQAVQNVAGDGILTLVDAIVTGGSTLIAMIFLVDWRLTLAAMLPLPLLTIIAQYLGRRLHDAYLDSQAAFSRLNNKTQESLSGIKVLKTFGQSEQDAEAFNQMTYETIGINKKVFRIDSLYDPLITLVIGVTYVITIIYGGSLVTSRAISLGQLITFVAYIGTMVWPMFAIGYLFNILERGSASYDRIDNLLKEKSLIVDSSDGKESERRLEGQLRYHITSFAYPDEPDQAVLKNVDFDLKPGQTVGLVGRVGSGKTTIIQLLMREFDNYKGRITFAGHDIRQVPLDVYLKEISYVPQNNFLFSMSVRDNIAFAKPDASKEEVEAAAKKAALHDDILAFPKGYQTMIGENGVSLSGGQKQRMSIARALLNNSEILILDDALSAVDAKTEKAILANLRKEREQKITVIAAHRLSSVMDADLILVMKDGRVAEAGTHDQLLGLGGWYKRMWDRQELAKKVGESDE
ncbi:Multidrug ABC superfamily ATP binding cassette transporter, ABC protein [Lactobacillus equicursoris DSM 19284 = JCM 14600 = CIP 110162]|uniref:ABC transporter, ATP-binding permease n=1 Tax=Lactobacillus equicursoris DSM 19284 = JCM 14600 = CIP 110162 TaxID=1293597 RepID=K0NVZ5_9LACO|nr:ABC transporter transmembrane domain-containing protein [Lactobacillus equicursoris]KRL03695.1 ABC transporter, ATP-binding permease [Lactobacillus equicursoris DSM 19284 = JCM 14600 = CIP 110162]CCK84891.1 Multidrug ABC superfamily ATP binding cassette transporter, ABC protein [Lactobacillus equicursoris DSM 19284 = JCM 14600 = CIP 110162]